MGRKFDKATKPSHSSSKMDTLLTTVNSQCVFAFSLPLTRRDGGPRLGEAKALDVGVRPVLGQILSLSIGLLKLLNVLESAFVPMS